MSADIFLFLLLAAGVLAVVYGVWRYWNSLVEVSPEEKEYDRQVADLNERQANRISDEQLTKPPSDDDAWQIIQRRGQQAMRRKREKPAPTSTTRKKGDRRK
ncbi:MAG: hypothetical protein SH847_03010 [Roseiflexaceae bacterium]|nr:hypothetical protein [Roseiflexaceae bacterium]